MATITRFFSDVVSGGVTWGGVDVVFYQYWRQMVAAYTCAYMAKSKKKTAIF